MAHNKRDNVGVVVVEGLAAGADMLCVITENDSEFRLVAQDAVAIGHKIALIDLEEGDTVYKYGEDIGRVVQAVKKGCHVHTHNIKTKRW